MDQNTDIKKIIHRLYKKEFLSVTEIKELETWILNLEDNQSFEAWLQANWQSSEDLPVEISFEKIRQLIRKKTNDTKKTFSLNRLQRIAAILFIPLLLGSIFMVYQKFNTTDQWVSLRTAKGERSHVTLPDGSDVWLNVDTELKYSTAYNETNRTLKLSGEAFFKVAKHKEHPFLVHAKNFQVKAVGTEFGVTAYNNETKVETFLKEGIVAVKTISGNHKEIRLNPGQKSIHTDGSYEITVNQTVIESDAAWTGGHLVFQNEDIPTVFRKIERWFNVSIRYNPEEFTNETLYVNMKSGETLDKLLQIIENAISIQINRNGDELTIAKK